MKVTKRRTRTFAELGLISALLGVIVALAPPGCTRPTPNAQPPALARAVGSWGRPGPQGPPGAAGPQGPPGAGALPMGASGGAHAPGLTPDTPATAGAAKYLREDGTWALPPASAPAASPPARFDVRDYGAVAHDTTGLTFPAACEAARVDMAAYLAANPTCGATLYVPAGHWYTAYPVDFDLDYATFAGDGADTTTLESINGGGFSPLIVGARRAPAGITLTADHWVDLNGKLDFVGAPGQFYGVRTKTDAHVAFWASPWTYTGCALDGSDSYWSGVRQTTIDFCVDWNGTALNPAINQCDMFGMWDSTQACPWSLSATGNTYVLQFVLSDGGTRIATFTIPAAVPLTGVHRVSIQVDTIGGTVQAYVGSTNANRTQVAVTLTGVAFNAGTNLPFLANEIHPFLIGGVSENAAYAGGYAHQDRSFYGLQLSRGLLYANNGVGTPQARIDAAAINDTNSFNSGASTTIVRMRNVPPATGSGGPYGGRLVGWYAGPGSGYAGFGYGLFISSGIQMNTNYNTYSQGVRDCTLRTAAPPCPHGQGLTIAGVYSLRVTNVNAYGGCHGIGSLYFGASYPIFVDRCQATGWDASFEFLGHILYASKLDCDRAGTTAIRINGSGSIRDVSISDQEHRGRAMILWHTSQDPRQLLIENVVIDAEGWTFPLQGVVVAENGYGFKTNLTVRHIAAGTVGASTAAVVALVDNPLPIFGAAAQDKALATIEDLQTLGNVFRAFVTTDGPVWKGRIKGQAVVAGDPPILQHIGAGSTGMVVESFP